MPNVTCGNCGREYPYPGNLPYINCACGARVFKPKEEIADLSPKEEKPPEPPKEEKKSSSKKVKKKRLLKKKSPPNPQKKKP